LPEDFEEKIKDIRDKLESVRGAISGEVKYKESVDNTRQ